MPNNIKTLEQKLHEDAERMLQDEIQTALGPINRLAGHGGTITIPADKIRVDHTTGADVYKVDTYFVIAALRKTLYIDNVEERRDMIVDQFLNEVADFRERLNELEEREERMDHG